MSISTARTQDPLRPPATGFKAWLMTWVAARIPFGFRVLRAIRPILRFRNTVVVTRYDDVREVFLNDHAFRVPWARKVGIITGGFPFFLRLDRTPVSLARTPPLAQVV